MHSIQPMTHEKPGAIAIQSSAPIYAQKKPETNSEEKVNRDNSFLTFIHPNNDNDNRFLAMLTHPTYTHHL